MTVAEGQIEREARRVLLRLLGEQTYLSPLESLDYGLFVPRNKWRKPVLTTSSEIVQIFMERDLLYQISGTGKRLILSGVGQHYVRRLTQPADPFLSQHRVAGRRYIADAGKPNAFYPVNLGETPLGRLRRRKGPDGKPLLTDHQFDAGERLREDFTKAQLTPKITSDLSLPPGQKTRRGPSTALNIQDVALAARDRVHNALQAVGSGLSDVLLEVCCLLNGLEQMEQNLGWPRRSGKVVLLIALDRLADHYGLTGSEPGRKHRRFWRDGVAGQAGPED